MVNTFRPLIPVKNKIFFLSRQIIRPKSRNNTINIESIVFVGDNNEPSSKSKSKSKKNSKEKKNIFTPRNMFIKRDFRNDRSNFLNKYKIKYNTNTNSIKNIISSKMKKKGTKKKINYHNISLKLTENKFMLGNKNHSKNGKRNKFNMNNKK